MIINVDNSNMNPDPDAEKPEDKEKANRLCTVSLILGILSMIGLFVGLGVIVGSFANTLESEDGSKGVFNTICMLLFVGAFVLMLYARVRYPKNKFAKVLMWVYIAIIAIVIIGIILLMIACAGILASFTDCAGGMIECMEVTGLYWIGNL